MQKPFWEKPGSSVLVKKSLEQSECRILSTTISHKKFEIWNWIFVFDQTAIQATILFSHFRSLWLGMIDMSKVMADRDSASS